MSQSPAILNTPHPMKKKIIAALVAVVIGHVGVLWAVSHMKTIELRPVEKQPLKVKFVKIKEPPKPEPPKPKEKPKPPEPKKEVKEVKVVEKALPPPPKKIQQVKKAETPKPVVETVEPKVESVVVNTTVTEKVIEKPQPVVEAPKLAAPPADPSPKRVSIGGSGVQWSRSPKLSVSAKDLENQPRSAMVLIEADEKGKITNARITRSSGLPSLDEKILRAVRSAKFKPYMENGVAYPIRAEQPFDLSP
ncbi:TonB family protein [Acinetobacter sp. VNH17]|uniref:TonB family protein n=1 Tax=Acinetobacter thutiue TaxID=2998078 RepID=A0ABT7WQB8_9GAMM|nr:TonB family protein [Acinetobacter thutiue]MCY6412775.1 TonB family protein [Acinetobacter thutiue]MDM1020732.1 TonB family protein [Acinetobacter thutiue]MDN0014882.1 TonB family protein [Acinetobacter thutiue]